MAGCTLLLMVSWSTVYGVFARFPHEGVTMGWNGTGNYYNCMRCSVLFVSFDSRGKDGDGTRGTRAVCFMVLRLVACIIVYCDQKSCKGWQLMAADRTALRWTEVSSDGIDSRVWG
ncbi:hypothetical protein BU16DRAFT_115097 [Lophium mytilinum]|uniref:Secreted protein n=1 Tax=Lophium mytilinum TaxID=390894 RepID=A0A6A6QJ82_9PEZI|nr:hypothetical protein BU16DRAFT_115097 [Lophium mytilinum]